MNKKALDKESLDELFEKYSNIVNKNEIRFLGEVARFKPKREGRNLPNPNYRTMTIRNEDGEVVKQFKTGRIIVEIPCPFRMDENQHLYPTKLPVFTTDYGVDNFQEVLPYREKIDYDSESERPRQWIYGVGRVQNYSVVSNITEDGEILSYLRNISIRKYGHVDEEKVLEMGRAMRIVADDNNINYIPSTNIWCDEIADAGDIVSQYIEKNKPIQENNVLLQGLVYMPPSIRTIHDGQLCIHFKLRVKREVEEGRNIPTLQEARDGYDIINIVGFGDNVEKWYENIEQGHPVKIIGRLESSRFVQKFAVVEKAQQLLAKILDVTVGDVLIQDIVSFVKNQHKKISRPSYNVWASEIETDIEKLDKE